MRLGRYSFGWNSVRAMRRMVRDAVRVKVRGIPRIPHESGADLATKVLQANALDVFRAGAGHFHVMWPVDLGKAFGGALHALPRPYVAGLLSRMVRTGASLGWVPTCFTPSGHYDLPWKRADNVPWILHMVRELNDAEFVAAHHRDLSRVYADWVRDHVDSRTGLVARHVWGDWMDTVPRPSSTYNNLVAIRGYEAADALGITSAPTWKRDGERELLASRWTGSFFVDHAGDDAVYLSADANVPALYFGLFDRGTRARLADAIESSNLADPWPMRTRVGAYAWRDLPPLTKLAPSYHTTTWLHLGLMYMNGLKRLERPFAHHLAKVDATIARHGNFLETLRADGSPWHAGLATCEYGFSMSAGQYLELVGPAGGAGVAAPAREGLVA